MRRESEAIETRVCGLHLALGGEHKQDDRRRGGPGGELIRDIMSYSEQGKVALYCEPIVHWEGSITCNTWHDDTIPVWEGGFSVYFTQS